MKAVETERRGRLSITGGPIVGAFDRMRGGRALRDRERVEALNDE